MKRRSALLGALIIVAACTFTLCALAVIWNGCEMPEFSALLPVIKAGALLGVAQLLLRPLLRTLSAPLGCITLGAGGLAIDVGLLYLCACFVRGFTVPDAGFALIAAVMIDALALATIGRK